MGAGVRRRIVWITCCAVLAVTVMSGSAAAAPAGSSEFYVPKPNPDAINQIAALRAAGNKTDADLIEAMVDTPSAVWFTSGTPRQVGQAVKATVQRAEGKKAVPVLVAYYVPGRDCSQYSAGGAPDGDAYRAWIDAFAEAIGDSEVVLILEPDGVALTPADCGQPDTYDRVGLIRYAVATFAAEAPNAAVYLDAGHNAWHNVGDIAARLVAAGVGDAAGFYLNPSNYQYTENVVQYGTWISKCIALGPGADCPNQYWNGGPLPAKIAELLGEWTGVALSPYGIWSDESDDPALNTSGINLRYGAVDGTTHFVVDTSRNGQGPWLPDAAYPSPEDWCNPPDRGLGIRPTQDTGHELVDAYVWIKIPGESDGRCLRGTAGPEDPARAIVDPAAGQWFPEMALELVHNANPAP
ncbi:MAG TPA: glycoside hydrolase family 6 protein [Clostridia bacterium]|nr:glycoside hydrolase family 6 protein [Clostridia bacterium]